MGWDFVKLSKTKQIISLSVEDVFTPGQFPKHTYNSREEVERQFKEWHKARGTILVVHGPSKTGKTVLLEKLVEDENPIWIDGGGITSVSVLWDRITDSLGGFSAVQRMVGESDKLAGEVNGTLKTPLANLGSKVSTDSSTQSGETYSVERPKESVVRDALKVIDRTLIIDDIHFVAATVQEEIIKAVKPLVFGAGTADRKGRRVIFVSIGNRVQQVISRLPDMRGRMKPLQMQFWDNEDLCKIASDGFEKLEVHDQDGEIAKQLASNSFGSPQLMQQLCLEVCRDPANGVRQTSKPGTTLNPPEDWSKFYQSQLLDEMGAWIDKLAEGPAVRGQERKERKLRSGMQVDGYKLTLLALAETGPQLTVSKSDLEAKIRDICEPDPSNRRISAPTAILKNMSLIAATKLEDKIPPLETLRQKRESGFDPYAEADLQPVLEYVDQGPLSELKITEPFFAYYLAWGRGRIQGGKQVSTVDVEDEDDWGE